MEPIKVNGRDYVKKIDGNWYHKRYSLQKLDVIYERVTLKDFINGLEYLLAYHLFVQSTLNGISHDQD